MSESVYGNIVTAADVEDAVLACMQEWADSYLNEIERLSGTEVGALPRPRAYVRSAAVEKFPEDQLPVVMLASPGLTDAPLADGLGRFTARWRMLVGVQIVARGNRLALTLARRYAAALRTALLQQANLPGLAVRRIDWMGERYDVLDSIDDRTVCVAQIELAIEVADVTNRNTGPMVPEPPPADPNAPTWPVAQEVDVEVLKQGDP